MTFMIDWVLMISVPVGRDSVASGDGRDALKGSKKLIKQRIGIIRSRIH